MNIDNMREQLKRLGYLTTGIVNYLHQTLITTNGNNGFHQAT
ncbi:MAG: hypothetical protein Ct9H90mP18_06100 [Gammaproteobacteria bacterium]|nr:MAG: hypothetical protein Ct9H90mP18_06100 [Gammaproteobacteria bacterium]